MKEAQTSEMLVCFTCSRLWITTASEQHLNCYNFLLKVLYLYIFGKNHIPLKIVFFLLFRKTDCLNIDMKNESCLLV